MVPLLKGVNVIIVFIVLLIFIFIYTYNADVIMLCEMTLFLNNYYKSVFF